MNKTKLNTDFVKHVFSEVPQTYEITNHVLTLGFDILWQKRTAGIAAAHGGKSWVDMCTVTGETAAYLSRLAPSFIGF